ncbi:MAG TPA: Fur family transcriptional regulator [Actinomycetota bacterium]|nr:Fur family transcriptional regulator [Actinomycetota bacterium]
MNVVGTHDLRDDLPQVLRAQGLRVTPQRLAVLAALHASTDHMSAEEVYDEVRREMPSVSLATVYNTLGELRRLGQLRDLPVSGKVRYDLVARGTHHHLVCESCHRVVDLDESELPSPHLPPGKAKGFKILTAEIIFRSICPECCAGGVGVAGASATDRDKAGTTSGAAASNMEYQQSHPTPPQEMK